MTEDESLENNDPTKWGSYSNIHKIFRNDGINPIDADEIMNLNVTITDKIDGSNLGIHLKKDGPSYQIFQLLGRNKAIWSSEDGKPLTSVPKYGNAGSLVGLPEKMLEFSLRFLSTFDESSQPEEIMIFGEAYRSLLSNQVSWHPFGYKVPEDGFKTRHLTLSLHDRFSQSSRQTPLSSHEELIEFLRAQTSPIVCPPPILIHGPLGECIDRLHPLLMRFVREGEGSRRELDFEGGFIVSEDERLGCKWKTPRFEEQNSICPVEESIFHSSPHHVERFNKLAEIFGARFTLAQPTPAAKPSSSSSAPNELTLLITTAFERELSKSESYSEVPKQNRMKVVLPELLPRVIKEVVRGFEENGETCPYPAATLEKSVKSTITPLIMKL